MLLYWYTCISINIYCFGIYYISLEMVWWALSNASLITWIHLAIYEILANKTFIVTDGLISWLFVVAFVHSIHMQITIIWNFPVQLSLWKSVYWLWRYKLNKVCNKDFYRNYKRTWQEFPVIFLYYIYIISTSSNLNYIYCLWIYYIYTIRIIYCRYYFSLFYYILDLQYYII